MEEALFLVVVVYKIDCFVADFEEGSSSACLVKTKLQMRRPNREAECT
jgi:hypothetical protein